MNHSPIAPVLDVEADPLLAKFKETRTATEALAAPLAAEDCVVQTMPDVSPTKWHLAHTTWFFEQFVLTPFSESTYTPVHPRYADLFNSYYNAIGPQFHRPNRGLLTRPTLEEVRAYRCEIDARVANLLATASPEHLAKLAPVVTLGIQHEQQHQELILTDIKHVLAANPLWPVYREHEFLERATTPQTWHSYDEGLFVAGAPEWERTKPATFVFDNECPRHRVFLEAFELATRPITNGEYLDFVEAGGYEQPQHWLSMGWDKAQRSSWTAPLYWFQEDGPSGPWSQFTLHGARALDRAEAVCHLSYFEADAFARWAGARLPTEFEWERAASEQPAPPCDGILAARAVHPNAAGAASGAPLRQFYGEVWEWTSSSYAPYPGYQPAPGALGEYNGKFMCNQYVLRGGSCATPIGHVRASYRNFFPPDARWQFSGLRLARNCS